MNLVENHHCTVKLYTLAGAFAVEKITLRCTKCSLSYNYDKWGNKRARGFAYYSEQREFVEVNDTTYFDRQLLELQCSLGYMHINSYY